MSRGVKYDYDYMSFHAFRHAARQSGPEEKYAFQSLTYKGFEIGVFSDGISGALGRPAAQSSGAKNLVSTRFFTLYPCSVFKAFPRKWVLLLFREKHVVHVKITEKRALCKSRLL